MSCRAAALVGLVALLAASCSATVPPPPSDLQTEPTSASVTSGPAASLPAGNVTRTPNATDAAFADAAAAQAFANMDVPALYVGVWDPQRGSFVRAYGHAVRDAAQATTDDSFRVASITKTFTSTVVLKLVDDGKIDLDGQIAAYLDAPLAQEPKLVGITVRQLLGMQSGLADYLVNPNGIATQIAANPARAWTPLELVEAALALETDPPGTGGYSNTNFVLLGLIAEHVSGTSLKSLISEDLTGPRSLSHTFLPDASDTALPAPAAHGYLNQACVDKAASAGAPNVDLQTDTTDWNTSYFYGAGGMVSTLGDLGNWADTELGTNLLSARTATERLTMHDIGGDGFLYGLGIKQFGNWYGHDGDAFGWDSLALHDPTTGVSYVAAVNSCTDYNDALLDLIQTLYPDEPTRS